MKHLPYPKIERTRPGEVSPGGDWVVLEKVHGAQLVAGADERNVYIGKRKAWLEPNEPFFGWQRLRCDIENTASSVRERLGCATVRMYGELCGEAVQTGVDYGPNLRVLWFDTIVDDKEFISYSELVKVLAGVGKVVPMIRRGPRTSLDVPVRYNTLVPGGSGVAEGWVKKPDRRMLVGEHYSLKQKIPEFDELDNVFDQSVAFDPDAPVPFEHLLRWARLMVNEPRLASARSKVGTDNHRVSEEVVIDVLCDLASTWPKAMEELTDEQSDTTVSTIIDALHSLGV
jgi:hypothetical protein